MRDVRAALIEELRKQLRVLCPRARQHLRNNRLFLPRQIANVALYGFHDHTPLRLFSDQAQRDEFVPCQLRKPEANLRIIFDTLTAITGGRAPDLYGLHVAFRRS